MAKRPAGGLTTLDSRSRPQRCLISPPRKKGLQWLQNSPAIPAQAPQLTDPSWGERPRPTGDRRRPTTLVPSTQRKGGSPPRNRAGVVEHRDIAVAEPQCKPPTGFPRIREDKQLGVGDFAGGRRHQRPARPCDLHQGRGWQTGLQHGVLHLKGTCLNVCVMDPEAIPGECALPC